MENLTITDASVFPTSASVNPSLTIAANALRSAERLLARAPVARVTGLLNLDLRHGSNLS